ncbi:hypothetical protein GLAREA_09527 [Glarea lozoyensis ATCC 20868]|uniref:Uncharacterized protein n=2 Tax=Glarea lozoyensis TaxID=101852 RepID=S3CPK8_GLAL2|nr:uncharacterized protein GLAREA_09527 [Glarea lozoyensis ATCC 20868]EHK98694.1 hypothetical protein M7I_5442 [Glarea lozoyensis 74030]EPE28407.1 hypothetical protein GLAREA_09527 [Glarea lozoyensis ATCC 20868]
MDLNLLHQQLKEKIEGHLKMYDKAADDLNKGLLPLCPDGTTRCIGELWEFLNQRQAWVNRHIHGLHVHVEKFRDLLFLEAEYRKKLDEFAQKDNILGRKMDNIGQQMDCALDAINMIQVPTLPDGHAGMLHPEREIADLEAEWRQLKEEERMLKLEREMDREKLQSALAEQNKAEIAAAAMIDQHNENEAAIEKYRVASKEVQELSRNKILLDSRLDAIIKDMESVNSPPFVHPDVDSTDGKGKDACGFNG